MHTRIDSAYLGDESRHLPIEELERRLALLPPSPRDVGSVHLLVRRLDGGLRESPASVTLSVEGGMSGDSWSRDDDRSAEAQLTAVEARVAALIANDQPLRLFGDQLFLDLDLSSANLPIGSRVRVGSALLEVTPKPHNGCSKYRARFGADALRFVARPDLRPRNFRGIYLRVITEGVVSAGDPAVVIRS